MPKREIEAQKVLGDIRAGMDHHSLMTAYRLSAEELRHLLQRLVHAGLIGLAELDRRMPAFMGTCFIDDIGSERCEQQDDPLREDEVLEDIRSGMDERHMRRKYGISKQAFRSILDHLLLSGLLERSEVGPEVISGRYSDCQKL